MWRKSVAWLLVAFGLVPLLFAVALAKTAAAQTSAGRETPGSLQALDPGGISLGICPLVHTDVKAEISGILSRVTVQQSFSNSFKVPVEALYTFPLPHTAAIDDMTIHVAQRTIRGMIQRREEAQAMYESARAQGKLAALLDQERPNIFSQKIANLLPGQNVEVTISYIETLKYENGGYRFVFPMVVGPRYVPGIPMGHQGAGWSADTGTVPDASRITPPVTIPGTRAGHDISIQVSIDSGVPFTNLRSSQHEIVTLQRDSHYALVQLANRATIPNKDFILSYDVAGEALQDGLVTYRMGEAGYFMLILQPPRHVTLEQVVPKELVFVLDTSGSMQGFPIEKAKETMNLALNGLYPHDTFNLITFSGDTRILFPQPVPATPENLARARALLASSAGSGGTEMMQAIRAALTPSDDQGHVRIVCFMTDGLVGNDLQIISEVQKHPNARVFAFGIGSAPNRALLDRVSEEGRGAVEYVTLSGDAAAAAGRFHERIRNPLLTDITVDWNGGPITDVYPRRIPDLFGAEPVVLCGRYLRGGAISLHLTGKTGFGDFTRDLRLSLPDYEARHDTLPKLWARRRIDALMGGNLEGIRRGQPKPEIKEAIVDLGLRYRLMTQFTSFVAIEDKIVNRSGKTQQIQVPVEMPEGISYQGVFGPPPSIGVSGIVGGVAGGVIGGISGGMAGVAGGIDSKSAAGGVLSGIAPPPPPAQNPVEPVRIGGNIREAKLIRKVDPVLPELARMARVSGMVLLEVNVDEQGDVSAAHVIRGHPLLNDAALQAVRQWKYEPTLLSGKPVPVVATVSLSFHDPGIGKPRLDAAVANLIARIRSGGKPDLDEQRFVHEGKVELELTVDLNSAKWKADLQALGFEVISWQGPTAVTGRIQVDRVDSLLKSDAVVYIAAHYR
jgi:Ca-activated chloride channel homolog